MKNLAKLFPFVSEVYSEKGISQSEAKGLKEKNKNFVEEKSANLEYDADRLYQKIIDVISEKGFNSYPQSFEPMLVSEFDIVDEFVEKNKQSSVIGFALNRIEAIRNTINALNVEQINLLFDVQKPQMNILSRDVVRGKTLAQYLTIEKIEELFEYANSDLFELIKDKLEEGLEVESVAALYGKLFNQSQSVLKKIVNSKNSLPTIESKTENMITNTRFELKIDKESFLKKMNETEEKYNLFQNKRNAIVKFIKDKARELQQKFDSEYQNALKKFNADMEVFNKLGESNRLILLQELSDLRIKI